MQTFLSTLTQPQKQPLAHVVHIGAGTGEGVAAWQAAGARMITLIEGDPGIAEQLETQVGAHEGVRVVQAVVSGDLRERAFRRMNFPDLNSLRAPTGLKQLFPGLKTLSKELVQPVDPAGLIAPLDLSDTGEGTGEDTGEDTGEEAGANLLVIETPGEALGILRALAAADLLLRFDWIHLVEAREPLYNKAPPAADIFAYLGEAGFSVAFEDAPLDPEQPWLTARLDRAALALKRRFEAMTAKLAQAEAGNAALSGDLERVTGEVGKLRAALEAAQRQSDEQASEWAAAVDEIEGVRAELAGVREQLAGVQNEAAQVAEQLVGSQNEAAQVREQLVGSQNEAAQVREQLVGAQNEIVQVREQLAGSQNETAQVREQLVGARKEVAQVREQLAGARKEVAQGVEKLAGAQGKTAQRAAQLADVQREAVQRAEQVAVLRTAREEMSLEMAAVKAEAAQARRRAAEQITEQITQAAQLNGQFQGQIEGLNSQLAGVQADLTQRIDQVAGLRAAREDVAQEMQRLRTELAEATEQIAGQITEQATEQALKEARTGDEPTKETSKEASKAASKAAEHRLGQARDEMLKAEGQINLIRDLLLHGPHL